MGPNMAASAAKRERCAERTGVGPFPYVAGTLEVLSMPLAEYIIEQSYVGMFVQRAHSRIPVAWSLGEDTVLGMWVHMTPFAITALHWGWDKIHDLCFLCKDKTQLWKPITTQTVVVHIKGHQVCAHSHAFARAVVHHTRSPPLPHAGFVVQFWQCTQQHFRAMRRGLYAGGPAVRRAQPRRSLWAQ